MSDYVPSVLRGVPDADSYVNLGNVVRQCLAMQAQYGNRYAGGRDVPAAPDLTTAEHGDGRTLRVLGAIADYHGMVIHEDDAAEYVRRVAAHRLSCYSISQTDHDHMIARLAEPLRERF